MKQKDIIVLALVGVVSVVFAFIISGVIFSSPKSRSTEVPVVGAISPTFPSVADDPGYTTIFNKDALDPTQLIQIGQNQNPTPFNQPAQQ